jgi:hypothetical protein
MLASHDPSAETRRLTHEVLRTGLDLALLSRESTDVDVSDFSSRAAKRLCRTASLVLEREAADDDEAQSLRADLQRLKATLDA